MFILTAKKTQKRNDMIIHAAAYPRAGLIGNPSDGYYGKTIAFVFSNFKAEITLYQTPQLEILPNTRDHSKFNGIRELAKDVRLYGYYGGVRLLKATIKKFHDFCVENDIELDDRNFTIQYHTDIPSQVGLAGSSAIITACMRALMAFYQVSIPKPVKANLILAVEKDELGISAGLQDRVAQVYEGLTYMDFDRQIMKRQGHGRYEALDPALLPPLYIAYRSDLSEGSEIFHNDIRHRFNRGEPDVIAAMEYWASLAEKAMSCLLEGRQSEIGSLLDANFDMRRKIYKISEANIAMVEAARSVGASAKFTGSGGAIVGTYSDEDMFRKLQDVMDRISVKTLKPIIPTPNAGRV